MRERVAPERAALQSSETSSRRPSRAAAVWFCRRDSEDVLGRLKNSVSLPFPAARVQRARPCARCSRQSGRTSFGLARQLEQRSRQRSAGTVTASGSTDLSTLARLPQSHVAKIDRTPRLRMLARSIAGPSNWRGSRWSSGRATSWTSALDCRLRKGRKARAAQDPSRSILLSDSRGGVTGIPAWSRDRATG